MKLFSSLGLMALALTAAGADSPRGYYRFPAIHRDTIVFTAEGDLWRVDAKGGVAQRLTTHPGGETRAAISPDGQTIAFSAEYEGPTEVYTMPLAGGLPVRHTFQDAAPKFISWTPDGRVLFATEIYSTLPYLQLVAVDPQTGKQDFVPLAQASQGAYEPNGKRLIFTRFSQQTSSTKRYQGGWIENLWRYDGGDAEAVPLTVDFKGTSRNSMWWQDRIYFASDRDGVMNLWSMKADGKDLQQLTKHKDFDVKSPALSDGRIVYQSGADLWLFDIASGKDTQLDIRLATDFDQKRERWQKRPLDYLTSAHISPTGDRVALTARGQVFVAPIDSSRMVEIPRKPNVRYRNAKFLPDGKSLVALSDETGELEFWRLPANGLSQPQPLTTNGTVFRFPSVPSPDGKRLAWSDKDQKFWIHEIETGRTTLVVQSVQDGVEDFKWSPDSQWLAYVDRASNSVQQIYLYNVTDGSRTAITSDRLESYDPAWSPDGKWLYFLSDRELRSLVPSPWGIRQPEPFYTETTKIYALALTPDQRWPFQPEDEVHADKGDEKKDEKKDEEKKPEGAPSDKPEKNEKKSKGAKNETKIELKGLAARLFEVPLSAGNYSHLEVTAKHLIYVAEEVGFHGRSYIKQLEITNKDPRPKTFVEDAGAYELSADGKKMLIRRGESFYITAADSFAPARLEERANLWGWTFSITPSEEWRQIYNEAWRLLRDYFYDPHMHQVDWPAIRQKYLPLVERVSDRADLNDVIYEMSGELSTLHMYVRSGDERDGSDKIKLASLGAKLIRDESQGGWRVDRVYRGDPDFPEKLSPLNMPTVNIAEGDVITTINGRQTLSVAHPEMLLRNQAGKQVLVDVKSKDQDKTRRVVVEPMSGDRDSDLRYHEWELTRRERVEEVSKGQIGYVHLRAMNGTNITEWARGFFPVFNRQGLIIDVRNNRGGNIDAWILEKLLRKAWFWWQPRVGEPNSNMHYAFRGHVTVICNERTASDGEAFCEGFKRLGLGKVIGNRTWGGEIWLSARHWLVDSGMATAAETGVYGPEGEWLIEGHGVDPDIVVENLPHATYKGADAQLDAAIKHLQELIAKDPRPVPAPPKYPNKSFKR